MFNSNQPPSLRFPLLVPTPHSKESRLHLVIYIHEKVCRDQVLVVLNAILKMDPKSPFATGATPVLLCHEKVQ